MSTQKFKEICESMQAIQQPKLKEIKVLFIDKLRDFNIKDIQALDPKHQEIHTALKENLAILQKSIQESNGASNQLVSTARQKHIWSAIQAAAAVVVKPNDNTYQQFIKAINAAQEKISTPLSPETKNPLKKLFNAVKYFFTGGRDSRAFYRVQEASELLAGDKTITRQAGRRSEHSVKSLKSSIMALNEQLKPKTAAPDNTKADAPAAGPKPK